MLEDAKRLKTLNEIRNLGFELSPEIIEDLKPFADRVTNLRAVSDPNQLSHLVEDLSIFLLNYDLKSVAQVLRHLLKEEFDPDFVQRNPEFFYLTCGVWLVLASVLPETDPIWVPSILDSASKERRAAHIGAFYGQVLNAVQCCLFANTGTKEMGRLAAQAAHTCVQSATASMNSNSKQNKTPFSKDVKNHLPKFLLQDPEIKKAIWGPMGKDVFADYFE
uniref:Uncharacterized protein n=2 Tax=Aplanochytrium stocchinoi TaxID=215587 RepID=A0A7S3PGC8_9STRA